MSSYRLKIGCGNCYAERHYDIERGVSAGEADLICPNCGCSPTAEEYAIITKDKKIGTAKHETEEGEE